MLSNSAIKRYGRQLILPEFGPQGQERLQKSSVLIVGCGGLGCPAAAYLAAAGIGTLGLQDFDEVEESNLHRQVLHTEQAVGISKATSAATFCRKLNSNVIYKEFKEQLSSANALSIIEQFDVILDATDNVPTRYLINDACVMLKKPLVSGSALKFEGQLTVYNYEDGPCYRCLYPEPPPTETLSNCSDSGVLGPVPGVLGTMQATEAIKIICKFGENHSKRLYVYDALMGSHRTFKLRSRRKDCVVCGDNPTIRHLIDYEVFCETSATDKTQHISILEDKSRLSPKEYQEMMNTEVPHQLIDVRPAVEFDICHIPNAINLPWNTNNFLDSLKDSLAATDRTEHSVVFICKQGNDSQRVVKKVLESGVPLSSSQIVDVRGGLVGWSEQVDQTFPLY